MTVQKSVIPLLAVMRTVVYEWTLDTCTMLTRKLDVNWICIVQCKYSCSFTSFFVPTRPSITL